MVDRHVPGVTPAQVKAARRLVEAAEVSGDPVSDAMRSIAAARPTTVARASDAGQEQLDFGIGDLDDEAHVGYRGPTACAVAGVTYRQLDYWARTDLVTPSLHIADQRIYSFRDILALKIVKRLLDTGVSLQNVRTAIGHLRERGIRELAETTLLSDGETVYEARTSNEVIDLLRGGQGVFGIAISGPLREVAGSLAHLPSERAELGPPSESSKKLLRRRGRKAAG